MDTLSCNAILVEFDLEIESNVIPFEAVVVCEIRDSNDKKIKYEALDLYQMHSEWKPGENKVHHSLLLSAFAEKPSFLLVYIWNIRKTEFQILKGKIIVNGLPKL